MSFNINDYILDSRITALQYNYELIKTYTHLLVMGHRKSYCREIKPPLIFNN